MTTVITISNRKGGSGKSTTAVNLAAEWGARGLRTLLVDLDTQGHAGLGFGISSRPNESTAHHIFTVPGFELQEAVRSTEAQNVWVAPADQMFDGSAIDRRPTALARQLRGPELSSAFDVVVVDTPPALDMLLVNALCAADAVVVPIMPHCLSAEGVKQFTRLFFKAATTVNKGLKLVGILPIMIDGRSSHHAQIIRELSHRYGPERIMRGIRSDIQLAQAFAARRPVRDYAPRCRGALDYKSLSEDIMSAWGWTPSVAG